MTELLISCQAPFYKTSDSDNWKLVEPHHAKCVSADFRPGKIQTSLLSYRSS